MGSSQRAPKKERARTIPYYWSIATFDFRIDHDHDS